MIPGIIKDGSAKSALYLSSSGVMPVNNNCVKRIVYSIRFHIVKTSDVLTRIIIK